MTILDVAHLKPLNREINIPSENILTHTFIPVGPSQVFRSWLVPVASVRMPILLHPNAVAVDSPGILLLVIIAPRLNYRSAVTHWDKWGITTLEWFSVEMLQCSARRPFEARTDHLSIARTLYQNHLAAQRCPSKMKGRVVLPTTLAAIDSQSVVEPAPTRPVLELAYERRSTPQEAYATLYQRWRISPRDNPSGELLVDTRLIGQLYAYEGFPGSDMEYLDMRGFLGREAILDPLFGRTGGKFGQSMWRCRSINRPAHPMLAGVSSTLLPFHGGAAGGCNIIQEARNILNIDLGEHLRPMERSPEEEVQPRCA